MSGLNPREYDAKFFEFSKRAEDGPSGAGSRSKTFPEVPIIFRVSCGNPESRQGMVLGLGKIEGLLRTWVAPEPGPLNSLASDKDFFCSVNPDCESAIDSQSQDLSLDA